MSTERIALEDDIERIAKVVCTYYGYSFDEIQMKTRKREVVQTRQIAMYFSKMFTKASLAAIGRVIGNKNHATVLHACKAINNLKDTDKIIRGELDEIEEKVKRVVSIKSVYLTDKELKELLNEVLINRFHNC